MLVLRMQFDDVGVDDVGLDDAVAGAADHAVVDVLMLVLLVSFGLLVQLGCTCLPVLMIMVLMMMLAFTLMMLALILMKLMLMAPAVSDAGVDDAI